VLGDVELGGRSRSSICRISGATAPKSCLSVQAARCPRASAMPTVAASASTSTANSARAPGGRSWESTIASSRGDWTAFVSVSGRLQTTNTAGYRYGSSLLWSVQSQYFADPSLALVLGIDGRYAAPDQQSGQSVDSTGGALLALAPGFYWNMFGNAWLSARMQWPVYTPVWGAEHRARPRRGHTGSSAFERNVSLLRLGSGTIVAIEGW